MVFVIKTDSDREPEDLIGPFASEEEAVAWIRAEGAKAVAEAKEQFGYPEEFGEWFPPIGSEARYCGSLRQTCEAWRVWVSRTP